ncbi:uncharacterized protein J3D65DRAFT_356290 [Phyllosticta citribraziliensis]|uniref:Secreted protein n=1 Tax=Phyllosticta citribraziliensis TaxID=989973 RepID=A0ABR1LQ91_9PEZI
MACEGHAAPCDFGNLVLLFVVLAALLCPAALEDERLARTTQFFLRDGWPLGSGGCMNRDAASKSYAIVKEKRSLSLKRQGEQRTIPSRREKRRREDRPQGSTRWLPKREHIEFSRLGFPACVVFTIDQCARRAPDALTTRAESPQSSRDHQHQRH